MSALSSVWGRARRLMTVSWWSVVHLASVLAVVVALSYWTSQMTWFADDWSFLDSSRSVQSEGLEALFASYNQHWSTVSVALYRGVLAVFSMRSYYPFAVPLILAHAANVMLTRALMVRGGISTGLATLLPLTFLFLATAYTDLLWGFPVNLVGSITIGLVAALLASSPRLSRRRTLLVAFVLLLSAATSNAGVAMTAGVACYTLLRHGWSRALVVAGLPAVGFLAWYAGWGHREPAVCTGGLQPSALPMFIFRATEKGFSGLTAVSGGSLLVVVLLGVACYQVLAHRQIKPAAWALSSAGGCLLLYLLSAIGRSGCADDASRAPRYAYFAILVVPLIGVALDRWWRRGRFAMWLIIAVVLTSVVINFVHLDRLSSCREARVDAAFSQLAYLPDRPSAWNPQVTSDELSHLHEKYHLQLPVAPAEYPDPAAGC